MRLEIFQICKQFKTFGIDTFSYGINRGAPRRHIRVGTPLNATSKPRLPFKHASDVI